MSFFKVEDLPEDEARQPSVEVNSEEVEDLRRQLSDFETRQKDYDDLKARIDAFERQRVCIEKSPSSSSVVPTSEVFDEKTSKLLDEHKDWMRKNYRHQSEMNLVELQREYHKRKFDRFYLIYNKATKMFNFNLFIDHFENVKMRGK
jgi:hypothetical protein